MKITACLAWYDEPVDHLARMVRSLEGLADELVALDGSWALYPDGQVSSPPEQYRTLHVVARAVGLPLVTPFSAVWHSQVAKRDKLMQIATSLGSDWLLVIDGDEQITSFDRPAIEQLLTATERDVATVHCAHQGDVNHAAPIRRLYRAAAGISVQHAHNGYRTADGRWLHGDPTHVKLEPTVALPMSLTHHARSRGEARNQAALGYRRARRQAAAERWPTHSMQTHSHMSA